MQGQDKLFSCPRTGRREQIFQSLGWAELWCPSGFEPGFPDDENWCSSLGWCTAASSVPSLLSPSPPVAGGDTSWADSEVDSSCAGQPIHLWQFLKELLLKPHNYGRFIRWLNKDKGGQGCSGRWGG